MKTNDNILIVDDTPANLDLLEKVLSEQDYEVRPFPKGDMALKSIEADPPDLILLDIMMPDMDGYEVCQKLKLNEDTKDIPIIFISAKSVTIDKVKAFNLGAVDYVTKPFQLEEVLARVKTHLALRRYQLESENKNKELQHALEQLKNTQSQLVQSEKMASIGVLAAGIAHELNNPINFISISSKGLKKKLSSVVELLRQFDGNTMNSNQFDKIYQMIGDLDLPSRIQAIDELTANIETGAERVVDIVSGLRSFSRLDSSKKELTNIHKALESSLVILRNKIAQNISIHREYGDIPKFPAFPSKLAQVFMNILKNAIDAINGSSKTTHLDCISISTTIDELEGERYVKVAISDTGDGFSEEVKNRMFDPFFTTKEVGKGTGLGLSIVLGTVESHQGKIEVASKVGEGSIFTVYLPLEEKVK